MKRMQQSEWLKQAQRLAVGQSKRIYHGAETRPNLSIQNLGDRWCCYCHRCHVGDVVLKTHASAPKVTQKRVAAIPSDLTPYRELPLYTQSLIAGFLLSKGVDVYVMLNEDAMYTEREKRIVFKTPQGYIGRTVVNAEPKWCTYGVAACTHASFNLHAGRRVVLTEDYLSARKVVWACGQNTAAVAQLGTRISSAMLSELVAKGVRTLIGFYDGDDAGDEADTAARLRFSGLGFDYYSVNRDPDKDPKDHTAEEIRSKIVEALNGIRTSNTTGIT